MKNRLYFLGVDTKASAVNRIFPDWARLCEIRGAELVGLDAPQGAPAERIREMVSQVASDPDAAGALVTTHKVAVAAYARDLFARMHPDAEKLGEAACLVKKEDGLHAIAIDHKSSAIPLSYITDEPVRGDVLIFGGGGAGRAIALQLREHHAPSRVLVTDVDPNRLEETRAVTNVEIAPASENDRLLRELRSNALVINATGLGKDRPGSPISNDAIFPANATAWDLNYRGDLHFLRQARKQGVRAEDGWIYFVAGWLTVMSHVFGFELTTGLVVTALAGSVPPGNLKT